jgi:hypothetical protein
MENLSHDTDLLCEMLISLLIRGTQMENFQTGLVEHAIWSDSLYFLYVLLLSIPKILA